MPELVSDTLGPEALAGGPIGKVREGDLIEVIVDRNQLHGRIDLVGTIDLKTGQKKLTQCGLGNCLSCNNVLRRKHLVADAKLPRAHAIMGSTASCQRRHLGWVRL